MTYKIAIGEKKFEIEVGEIIGTEAEVTVDGKSYTVNIENLDELDFAPAGRRAATAEEPQPTRSVSAPQPAKTAKSPAPAVKAPAATTAAGENAITAPIPGVILEIMVKEHDPVAVGDVVATMEAMKMENNIVSRVNGTVKQIKARPKDQVSTGDVIMIIE